MIVQPQKLQLYLNAICFLDSFSSDFWIKDITKNAVVPLSGVYLQQFQGHDCTLQRPLGLLSDIGVITREIRSALVITLVWGDEIPSGVILCGSTKYCFLSFICPTQPQGFEVVPMEDYKGFIKTLIETRCHCSLDSAFSAYQLRANNLFLTSCSVAV